MNSKYYLLSSDASCDITHESFDKFKESNTYSCGHYRDPPIPEPLVATDYVFDGECQIFAMGIRFICNELIEIFSPYLEQEADLAELKDQENRIIVTGKIVWPHTKEIVIRGNNKSENFVCIECGRRIYFARGKHYVLNHDLNNVPFIITYLGFIFDQSIYEKMISHPKLKLIKKKKTCPIPFEILDEPRDGYPIDLNQTPTDDERYFST